MDGFDKAMAALVAILVLAIGGFTWWGLASKGPSCPPGQTLTETGAVPVFTGKVVVIVPIFTCTGG